MVTEKKYSPIITEIHNLFNTASENLLNEAEVILKEYELAESEKTKKLIDAGFIQAKQTKRHKEYIESQVKTAKIYLQKYPLYKFIRNEDVLEICSKYNLVIAELSDYKGFVPDSNLDEILNFKIKNEDKNEIFNSDIYSFCAFDEDEEYVYKEPEKEYRKMIICAPAKDIDINSKTFESSKLLSRIQDPVVLMPVNGGFLIVTAWGDESCDPLIFNGVKN